MSKNLKVSFRIAKKSKKTRSKEENLVKAIRLQIKNMVKNGQITQAFADENMNELIKQSLNKLNDK